MRMSLPASKRFYPLLYERSRSLASYNIPNAARERETQPEQGTQVGQVTLPTRLDALTRTYQKPCDRGHRRSVTHDIGFRFSGAFWEGTSYIRTFVQKKWMPA
ncbi:hypothetical protein ACMFMF_003864 [Clarireedia jacksonii]